MDQKILVWLNNIFIRAEFLYINKLFTEYLTYTLPIILLIMWFWPKDLIKKAAIRGFLSVLLAWPVISAIIGNFYYRSRPLNVSGVKEVLFHRPTYSFPSDHAAALFAVAASFYFSGLKKMSLLMTIIACLVSFFRIATGIHWFTDIFGGMIIGIISALIIKYLDKYFDKIYDGVIKQFKKVKLA